jgi:hypothetical protein
LEFPLFQDNIPKVRVDMGRSALFIRPYLCKFTGIPFKNKIKYSFLWFHGRNKAFSLFLIKGCFGEKSEEKQE